MNLKPYLISVATRVPSDVMYYGTVKNLGDSVEFRPVVLDTYPGNLERFFNLPNDLSLDRMVIFTDTADVIFQKPIPYLEEKIYITPEFNTWANSQWWTENFGKLFPDTFNQLRDTQVINAGTFAMPGYKLMELVEFMKKNKELLADATWSDQPLYNLWLKQQRTEDIIYNSQFMMCMYEAWPKEFMAWMDGDFVNDRKEIISIVHANGNTRDLLTKSKFLKEVRNEL